MTGSHRDLDGSGLQYMAPGALDPLRKLTLLDLSRQVAPFPITWLHPDIFRNLTSYTSTLYTRIEPGS